MMIMMMMTCSQDDMCRWDRDLHKQRPEHTQSASRAVETNCIAIFFEKSHIEIQCLACAQKAIALLLVQHKELDHWTVSSFKPVQVERSG